MTLRTHAGIFKQAVWSSFNLRLSTRNIWSLRTSHSQELSCLT